MLDFNIRFNLNLFSNPCLFRSKKSQPGNLEYGVIMKEKIPMEMFILIETGKLFSIAVKGSVLT